MAKGASIVCRITRCSITSRAADTGVDTGVAATGIVRAGIAVGHGLRRPRGIALNMEFSR